MKDGTFYYDEDENLPCDHCECYYDDLPCCICDEIRDFEFE